MQAFIKTLLPTAAFSQKFNFFTVSGLELSHHESSHHEFPEICSEDCDPLMVICSKYFFFSEYSFIY